MHGRKRSTLHKGSNYGASKLHRITFHIYSLAALVPSFSRFPSDRLLRYPAVASVRLMCFDCRNGWLKSDAEAGYDVFAFLLLRAEGMAGFYRCHCVSRSI